ncbi:ribosomal protein S6 kinase delta-1 isoform X3 [Canis lupus familiaris]|uniref:Ribosomal protein S6 kinase delta-1 n=3 Tax=Canis lupus TaxID=9612 RepID=A0A8C0MB68_CANLF|nr:ribosomal protein S6 kinase delta-1 isoform X3 [Canis lupus familiaris]XP_038398043.1 ribosomal protein S6 kinase delta-1 isoform X3 [Canis lupus familiaris]XP_038526897.1 ribosomal protein S6 kinase delta-1 isoform X3 [Canis lupus familiaris]|eukprot:XP_022276600.1 ribosomal protein S6 kinase delta-1 isoform X4 [Canis lupus familiaris]
MTSPRERGGDLARFYTVTEPQRHPRGYTVYKVTARVVSRRNPEDVQEIIVWKRYSDFKKLHKELWQIHKNLFRHSELFPPFAKGIVFGRFDETVIEERRQCAEDLLQFSANIPALYNSKQLEDFFKGGIINDGSELIGPAEAYSDSLVDSFPECSTEGFSSDSDLISLTVDVDSLAELDDGMASNQNSPVRTFGLNLSSDPSALGAVASDSEQNKPEEERESRSLFPGSLKSKLGKRDYLEKAGELIKLALKKEEEDDYEAASNFYRKGVDLLLEGVQGESSPTRREAVKRKTAEYLMRAENLSSLYGKPQLDDVSQVLLVMDTRTEQTFILKGLRKSSEYSRNRKTIIPRCVPNMVCLHKYIVSEESVFLVLQHAEGGKLWSYISKFLNRSPEESFDIGEVKKSTLTKVHLQQPTSSPQDSSSFESRGSDGGTIHKVLPLKTSLTPSSQDDSNQDEEGQDSSPKWPDSGSSSEEECTTSYLTLCNEYGQEKIEPGSLNEESFMKIGGNGVDTKVIESFPTHLAADSDSPSTQQMAHELKFFAGDDAVEAISSPGTSDSLNRSKNSPMEFFRIDSKDSTSELLGLDFGEKLYSLKSEPLKPFFTLPDGDSTSRSFTTSESKIEFIAQDTISRGSDDSVPVISFKDAAFDDVIGTDEGRPDLLVNLPGELEATKDGAAVGPTKFTQTNIGIIESKLLEAPDVLCLRLSTEQCQASEEEGTEELSDPSRPKSHSIAEKHNAQGDLGMLFVAAVDHSSSGDMSLSHSSDPNFQGLGVVESAVTANNTEESLFRISNPLSGANEYNVNTDTLKTEEVLLFTDQTEDLAKEELTLFQRDSATKGESGLALEGDKEIHQLFEDLDKKLALNSRFYIPEGCIQRWAAEMVVALDALHREGIVCRDLNPNNILLNDRGHIQLTYFSRWSEVEDSCDSDAIERMYCAPEVGAITEETEACDWWSLGAVLFELLTGKTLVECHPAGINTHTTLNMPECVSEEARSLIQQLLQFNPVERLGAGVAGVEDIKSHPFFNPVDWAELMR